MSVWSELPMSQGKGQSPKHQKFIPCWHICLPSPPQKNPSQEKTSKSCGYKMSTVNPLHWHLNACYSANGSSLNLWWYHFCAVCSDKFLLNCLNDSHVIYKQLLQSSLLFYLLVTNLNTKTSLLENRSWVYLNVG